MLTATFVKRIKCDKPTRFGDGRNGLGLSLLVKPTSEPGRMSKTWAVRFTRPNGTRTMVGLGSYPVVDLVRAREKALAVRQALEQGRNPELAVAPTFAHAVERTIAQRRGDWRPATEVQWRGSLEKWVLPHLGPVAVDTIGRADIFAVLEPLWERHPKTGRHVANRIGAVMDWVVGAGYRDDNPTKAAVAGLGKARRDVNHYEALHHSQITDALTAVEQAEGYRSKKLALRLLALTAARTKDVTHLTRDELDFDAKVWTISADRYKTRREHRIPLSDAACAVLAEASTITTGPLVFATPKGAVLPDNALRHLLQRAGVDATIHGFRSAFRNWCAETGVSREVAEASLGHVVQGVEGAYLRTDLLEQRRETLTDWAAYIVG